ncbi:MAG: hypothetical protein A3G87_09235 [Omnitrophica bacterium RIFCSPLOWO2_12_FULL_50_11]|nr:MAG: hypothetical protein A3G87_09235 [Omnitrophica bacterium RIFCSPLOWO2_12_FULL_50_11]
MTKQSSVLRLLRHCFGTLPRNDGRGALPRHRQGLLSRNHGCRIAVRVVFSFYFMLCTPSAFACPLCKEAIEKIGHVWTSMGFNWSIYFMLAVPFLLVGSFAAVLYFQYRKRSSA